MNVIRRIYLYKIFDNFMLIYPLYSIMFAQRGHLDTLQISTLFIVWSITGLLCEIPTGVLADHYSRRNLLVIGECIRGIGYATWLIWPSYGSFALGLILWGIGGSLDSGTFQALVFDELKAHGNERNYAKIVGRAESISMFVGIGATLLASPILKQFGYGGIVGISVVATFAAAFAATMLPDKKRQKFIVMPSYIRIVREAAAEVTNNPRLLQVIGFGILLATLFGVMDEYASLFLKAAGVTAYLIPLASAVMFLPSILVGFMAHRFEHVHPLLFMLVVVAAGLALFAAGRFLGLGGIVGFAVFLLLTKLAEIAFGAKLQHSIVGHTRSTITSINEFGVEIATIIAYLVYGLATKANGTGGALELFGLFTAVTGVMILLYTRGKLFGNTYIGTAVD